jgi:hypothetical protein
MAVRPIDRARLARLAAPLVEAERAPILCRMELRERVDFLELVRDLLLHQGVDPESTDVMRRLRAAEAKLAAIPDTPALRRADKKYLAREDTGWIDAEFRRGRRYRPPPVEEKTWEGEVERLIGRYREDPRIDFATTSPMCLFAWCLSRLDDSEVSLLLGDDPPETANPAETKTEAFLR